MSDAPRLNPFSALVTGGSRGIGRAVALSLAGYGASTIAVNYLENDADAAATQADVEARGAECVLVRANLALPAEIDRLFDLVADLAPPLGVFVHCAALGAFKPISSTKANQWDLTMNVGARSFLLCVQKCSALMSEGAIVAVSSLGSRRALPNYGAMGPTKAALESTVRYLAAELAPRGIRVNAVSAGLVRTASIEKMPHADRLMEEAAARTPAGRIAEPEDVADIVTFLVSPAARWIHGQVILADGGYSLI